MERIGIYGGTFNPPHIGHMEAARCAVDVLRLDKLLLIPDRDALHKVLPIGSATPQQRLEMLSMASRDMEKTQICRLEMDCKGTCYTHETVACLRQEYPEKCRTWRADETHWGRYKKMCYRPNLNMPVEYTLKYCSLEHYEEEGFVIIPYEDLIVSDIEESEQQIDLLLS